MEGNGRRLSWIAIALSALALFVAVSGRAQSRWQSAYGPPGNFGPPAGFVPQGVPGPQGNFAPQGQPGPQNWNGPQENFGPQAQPPLRGDQRQRLEVEKHPRFGGPHRPGGMFFFLPLIIGGLIKLVLAGLLILLGLKLLRGRRGSDGPAGGRRQDPPGPEQPPYTGETQQM